MALNTRGSIDPRFPFHHRDVVLGAMLGWGVLYRATPNVDGESTWNPKAVDPADREPVQSAAYTPVYEGPCRVQPNQGWRARTQNFRDETVVQHSILVQIDFRRNELKDAPVNLGVQFPAVDVGDVFKVTRSAELHGVKVDEQVTRYMYLVRNVTASTNGWARQLTCEIDATKAAF